MSDFTHVDDWLDNPPASMEDGERFARAFLEHCRRPAIDKDYAWIAANPLLCTWKGGTVRVLGASRLGDVWLTHDLSRVNGYDHRVDIKECSDWRAAA